MMKLNLSSGKAQITMTAAAVLGGLSAVKVFDVAVAWAVGGAVLAAALAMFVFLAIRGK